MEIHIRNTPENREALISWLNETADHDVICLRLDDDDDLVELFSLELEADEFGREYVTQVHVSMRDEVQ